MAIHCLPVVGDRPRVLADEVAFQLPDGSDAGLGPPLDDRLAEANDPGIGVNLQEEPARLDEDCLQSSDLQLFT